MATPADSPASDFGYRPRSRPRVLWKWSLLATAAVLVFLVWQCGAALVQGRRLANGAVRHFHEQLNNERYADIYGEADDGFRGGGEKQDLIKFFVAVHTRLGNAGPSALTSINVNATTNGTFITTVHNTTFARGSGVETFTWIRKGARLILYGYHINSNALIMN